MRLRAVSAGLARLLVDGPQVGGCSCVDGGVHILGAGTSLLEPLRGTLGNCGTRWRPSYDGAALVARCCTRRVVAVPVVAAVAVLRGAGRTLPLQAFVPALGAAGEAGLRAACGYRAARSAARSRVAATAVGGAKGAAGAAGAEAPAETTTMTTTGSLGIECGPVILAVQAGGAAKSPPLAFLPGALTSSQIMVYVESVVARALVVAFELGEEG